MLEETTFLDDCGEKEEAINQLERIIDAEEKDFLIGLHLEDYLPEDADIEEIAEDLLARFRKLPKKPGAHYKLPLNELGLDGFANVYYVGSGMGNVFFYSGPIMVGRSI